MNKDRIVIYLLSIIIGIAIFGYKTNKEEGLFKVNESKYLTGDAKNFYDRALSIIEYGNYTSNNNSAERVYYYRPPGYPLLLSFLLAVSQNSIKFVLFAQIFLYSLIPVLLFSISSMLLSRKSGIISGIISILFFPLWNLALQISSEWFSVLLWILTVYLILKYWNTKDSKYLFISGLTGGIAALTRGQFLVIVPLTLILVFEFDRKMFLIATKFIALFILPIILWGCYTYIKSDLFVVVSTQGPYALWWGNSPRIVLEQLYPLWNNAWDRAFYEQPDLIGKLLGENGKPNSWFINESFNFAINYPLEFFKIYFYKFFDFFGYDQIPKSMFTRLTSIIYNNYIVILLIPGIYLWKKNHFNTPYLKFVFIITIVYLIISLLTASMLRYRLSCLDPLYIIIISSIGTNKILDKREK